LSLPRNGGRRRCGISRKPRRNGGAGENHQLSGPPSGLAGPGLVSGSAAIGSGCPADDGAVTWNL